MVIRAYCRADVSAADLEHSKRTLTDFVEGYDQSIAAFFRDSMSGHMRHRAELKRLLDASDAGDVLLTESIAHIQRLNPVSWKDLVAGVTEHGVNVVCLDVPSSHALLGPFPSKRVKHAVQTAINGMLIDTLEATGRFDDEKRRSQQRIGIAKARREGRYRGVGRTIDSRSHDRILDLTAQGWSIREIHQKVGVSKSTVSRVRQRYNG
ncbi:MAG: recombinase family protein [Pseudomonadota bacterium]